MLRTIERERVTKLFARRRCGSRCCATPTSTHATCRSLRKGYYGASPMPIEILAEMQRRLPDLRLWNFYGQTEMAPLASILGPDEQLAHAGSAGRPALNVETADRRRRRPAGARRATVGEIVHRSPHVMLGYYDDEDEDRRGVPRRLVPLRRPRRTSTRTACSHVVDRKKDMIKTGGENVASREVEEVLYRHDGVAEVAVFGLRHPLWVEAVAAVVVPRQGVTLTDEDVLAHCREHLAGYKTPKYVVLVDALPKNPSGKILKRELRDAHAGLAQDD